MRHVWSRPHEYHSSSTWLRDKQLQWLIKVIEEKKTPPIIQCKASNIQLCKTLTFSSLCTFTNKIRNYKQLLAILFSLIKSIHWVVPKWKLKFIWTHNFIIVICTSKLLPWPFQPPIQSSSWLCPVLPGLPPLAPGTPACPSWVACLLMATVSKSRCLSHQPKQSLLYQDQNKKAMERSLSIVIIHSFWGSWLYVCHPKYWVLCILKTKTSHL